MKLLNVSTVTAGYKIQLIREVRKKWGIGKAAKGSKVAFYETDEGEIIIQLVG